MDPKKAVDKAAIRNRYEVFAREYVIDQNATRAAIAAGYSEKSADSKGSQLLDIVRVRRKIEELQAKRASKLEIKAEKVLEEIARLAFANMKDYVRVGADGKAEIDLSGLTRDQAAAIAEIREDATGGAGDGERKLVVRTTLKLADKIKNLELLGRHLGMWNDKLQISGDEALVEALLAGRKRITNGNTPTS